MNPNYSSLIIDTTCNIICIKIFICNFAVVKQNCEEFCITYWRSENL